VYCNALRLSRADLLAKLETLDDPLDIARLQGQAKQLRILEMMPQDIERLDKAILKVEELSTLRNNSPYGE
jgi:hypothetical protein